MATTVARRGAGQQADKVTFGAHLRQWRHRRNLSQRELGAATFFSREYIALIERGERPPTANFVERVEAALAADGAQWDRFTLAERQRAAASQQPIRPRPPSTDTPKPGSDRHRDPAVPPTPHEQDITTLALDHLLRQVLVRMGPAETQAGLHDRGRIIEVLGCGGAAASAEERIRAAALGLSECVALLRPTMPGEPHGQVTVLAARFATMIADGLTALEAGSDALSWYALAGQLAQPADLRSDPASDLASDAGSVGAAPDGGGTARTAMPGGATVLDTVRASGSRHRRAEPGRGPATRRRSTEGHRPRRRKAPSPLNGRAALPPVEVRSGPARAPP
ncbi:helix-turn-helix domain-containing protein [Dactylosporangium sp. CS-047395]|uniref:helix-turn-helix domain-containing protein n=1 Tax=Dactylosporangium sp. CS-047395 TaxID=3239936 RepID=UPI003D92D99A